MSDNSPLRDPSIAVHRFSDRISGRPADDVLRANLSTNLTANLHSWLRSFAKPFSETKVILSRAFDRLELDVQYLEETQQLDLLDLVDQVLDLSTGGKASNSDTVRKFIVGKVGELQVILADARSLYAVGRRDGGGVALVARVDPTIRSAVSELVEVSTSASAHLGRAWVALNKLQPDAPLAYREAVKALEVTLAPLITPDDSAPTLGKIKSVLRDDGWSFALDRSGPPGKAPAIAESANSSVTFLVDLIERVYGSERRHGDAEHQIQSQEEAAAAVYAAVAVIGWVASGTLVKTGGL